MPLARAWAVGLVGMLVLVALVPTGGPSSARPAEASGFAKGAATAGTAVVPPAPNVLGGLLQHNLSWDGPAASPPPDSALPETPPPALPATNPTVVYVTNSSRTCCGYVNVTPPGGPWDAVILNYTGTAVGGVYDSSYRAYIGGAQVFFGTTPEYGTWTVLANLTQYESLLEPGANFTFILSAALLGGYFETTLRLSFYPVPTGAIPPSEPSKVVPLWSHYITPSVPTLTVNASVPNDASAAVLQVWTYGFQTDEFWWSQSAPGTPDRALSVQVNGSEFAAVFPFPYINTGGVDLFLWRPIPAAFTLDDRPYDTNVTGALGQLEGTHSFTASIANRNSTSDWLVGGSLLLWTNPNVTSASATGGSATLSGVMSAGSTSTMTTSFAWSSVLTTTAGPVNASSTGTGSFSETKADVTVGAGLNGSQWTNLTQTSSLVDHTTTSQPGSTTWSNSTDAFQIGTDLATVFTEASSTGGSYPVTENVTTSMLDLAQKWTGQTSTDTRFASAPPTSLRATVDNEVTGGNGIWLGVETIATPSSAPNLISIVPVQSATPKYTAESWTDPDGTSAYSHVESGSAFAITDANDEETVLENRYDTIAAPLLASVTVEPDPVDAGTTVTISANADGGAGVYAYLWSGLPTGCGSGNATTFSCNATTAGTFRVTVAVSDGAGDEVVSAPSAVVVNPSLVAAITTTRPSADLGGPLAFFASVSGGAPPYSCSWSVSGGAPIVEACTKSLPVPTSVVGPVTAALQVFDGTGANVTARPVQVTVNGALIVTVAAATPNATVRVGSPASFLVTVLGGSSPWTISWYEGDQPLPGLNGTNATIVPTAVGSLSISAQVTDAAGGTANSSALSVTVAAALSSQNGSSTNSGSSGVDPVDWIAIGLAAVAAVEAVLLVGLRRPPSSANR